MSWQAQSRFTALILIIILILFAAFCSPSSADIECSAGKVCRNTETNLPLLALPRPYSNVYKSDHASTDNIVAENVKAFFPLYVFSRPTEKAVDPKTGEPQGWYQIGTSVRSPLGWMQAKDVMEWHHALIVAYTHPGVKGEPEARERVLWFRDVDTLQKLVEAKDRGKQAKELYAQIAQNQVPDDVISSEPNTGFLNIEEKDKFYVLPVIDFKRVDLFDDPARYLKLAAAVPRERAPPGQETVLSNESFRRQVVEGPVSEGQLGDLAIDLVFLMDMTASMQPEIDHTREAMLAIANTLTQDNAIKEKLHFGLVGYRDNVEMMPGLEFVSRNFTPQLVDDAALIRLLAPDGPAREASVSSGDWAEEVYAGVKEALASSWSANSLHFIVHIGDASGHPPGHPQNTTGGLDAVQLRQIADQQKVTYFSIHLLRPRAKIDWPIAEQQFKTLATNPGTESPLYFPVPEDKLDEYDRIVKDVAGRLAELIRQAQHTRGGLATAAKSGTVTLPPNASDQAPADTKSDTERQHKIEKAVTASLITYLGKEATPPRDVTGWTFDRDLIDPHKESLTPRLLVSREHLNNLIAALEQVVDAMVQQKFTRQSLFEALQGVMAGAQQGQQFDFKAGMDLASTKLLPRWIEALPYRSRILSLTNETFASMTPDERAALERDLKSKLELYRSYNNDPKLWIALDERDSTSEKVYPVPIDALP
jgi:serine/threonine-protein kinase PpkA